MTVTGPLTGSASSLCGLLAGLQKSLWVGDGTTQERMVEQGVSECIWAEEGAMPLPGLNRQKSQWELGTDDLQEAVKKEALVKKKLGCWIKQRKVAGPA